MARRKFWKDHTRYLLMINYLKRIALFETVLVIAILSLHFIAAGADAYAFPNSWLSETTPIIISKLPKT